MNIPNITIEDDDHIFYETGKIYSKKYKRNVGRKDKDGYMKFNSTTFQKILYEKFIGKKDKGECNICKSKIDLHVDHINEIRDDNRIENLQLLCRQCNIKKSRKTIKSSNTSGIIGVYYKNRDKKWVADIRIPNKKRIQKYFRFKYCAYICRKLWNRKYDLTN